MIQVIFINGSKEATSTPLHQWDYGQKMKIYGLDVTDEVIQVHFCDRSCQRTTVRLATKYNDYYQVAIPDGLLENHYSINAFVFVVASDSGTTTHHITIPVIARKKPEGFVSQDDPTIQSQVNQLIVDINAANAELLANAEELYDYVDDKVTEANNNSQGNSDAIRGIESSIEDIEEDISDIQTNQTSVNTKLRIEKNPTKIVKGLYSITLTYEENDDAGNYHYENEVISIDDTNRDIQGRLVQYGSSLQAFSLITASSHYSIASYTLILKY